MTISDDVKDLYQNDPQFHALAQCLRRWLDAGTLTFDQILSAAAVARELHRHDERMLQQIEADREGQKVSR